MINKRGGIKLDHPVSEKEHGKRLRSIIKITSRIKLKAKRGKNKILSNKTKALTIEKVFI